MLIEQYTIENQIFNIALRCQSESSPHPQEVADNTLFHGGFLMMEITRDVILDLLPLYLADEASSDTRKLVEEFLDSDKDLAKMAEQSKTLDFSEDIPVPLTKEDKMEAYEEAKRLQFHRTLIWAVVIAVIILSILGFVTLAAFFLFSV